MNSEQQLQQLLDHFGENEVVEFKEAKRGYDFGKLGKYFSALSNEANLKGLCCAWLVFGIKDNQTVVGSQFRTNEKDLHSLKGEIANHTTNRLTFIEIYVVQHSQGRVLLLQIPAAPQGIPVTFKGHYYGRDGEELGPLNLEEIERIRAQSRWQDWSAKVCHDATLADLSAEAIVRAKVEFTTKNPKLKDEIDAWDTITFLNKAKLTINGQLTRTAILLLGKAESAHYLSPASSTISWILKDRDGLEKDYEHFVCPLLINADTVFNKIRNLKYRYMTEGTLFPEEVDQFDPYIIREALNNAIAHQDYTLGGKVAVVEFEDGRLCFSNVGSFIPGSVENVIRADAPESRYRNRFLADAMVGLNMIDTIGSGIRKMFIIQKTRFFPLPEYNIRDNRVQVTITGRVLDINYARRLAETPDLSLEDIILLDRIQKHLPLSDEQARHLKQLGLIEGRK
ncbi:MAG: putative DNA binding domain-containing protein, partial [Deltaproteobacteria bacterium]|nr:putative DNA binding domain-containing protein [Deltaproteobacteria bacterium]